jgi:hypothetical protein
MINGQFLYKVSNRATSILLANQSDEKMEMLNMYKMKMSAKF